jgi:putative phage-type endonuclease
MRLLDLEQRSEAWLAWRQSGITATESAVILGLSPYKSPWRLWCEKVGRAQPAELSANPLVRFGIEHEDEVRQLFELKHLDVVMPACGEFDEDPIFRASFDGLTSTKEPVEIKCPSETTISDVKQRGLESDACRLYRIQVQHQLMVSGAQHGWLVFFDRTTNDLIEFVIERDEDLIAEIRCKGREFFDRFVKKRKEPPKDPARDIYVPNGDVEIARWNQFAADYAAAQQATEELQKQIEAYSAIKNRCQDELTEMMGEFLHADFAGVAITKRALRGTVNYRDFLQAKGIAESELEAFRGKGSESWLVRVTHENLPKDFQDEELEALLMQAQPTEDLWF